MRPFRVADLRPLPVASSLFCVGAALLVAPLEAQPVAILEARSLLEAGNVPTCSLGMVNDLALRLPGAHVSVVSAPVTDGLRQRVPLPLLAIDVSHTVDRRWQLRAAGAVGASEPRCASQSQWTRGWVQLARAIPRGGVAIGLGARSLSTLDPSRDRQGVSLAVWQQRGASRFAVDVRSFSTPSQSLNRFTYLVQRPDSVQSDSGWVRFTRPIEAPDSAIVTHRSQSIAVRTNWQRRIGPAALDLSAGAIGGLPGGGQVARDSAARGGVSGWARLQPWARADARVRLRPWMDVLVGVAALPTVPDPRSLRATGVTRTATSRVFSVGIAIAARNRPADAPDTTSPSESGDEPGTRVAFEARRIDETTDEAPMTDSIVHTGTATKDADDRVTVLLRLRDPAARTVEVSGEPFGWRAVPLRPTGEGWWEARVRLHTGTWRMSVRRDGRRWTAPPGLPALQDEFGGEVALVTIR